MTEPDARVAAEAVLAEAKARLREAEEAYRRVVPCEHRSIRHSYPDKWSCGDCGEPVPDPRGCLHAHVDNDTWKCTGCGELMINQAVEVETVLSAPNAVGCNNPDCGGMDDPECTNPEGLYVPDTARQRRVPVCRHFTYECERCRNKGVLITPREMVRDCGRDHRGDSIPIRAEEGTAA